MNSKFMKKVGMKRRNCILLAIVSVVPIVLGGCLASPPSPFPPSELAATLVSPVEIDLSWKDNSPDEKYFYLYRRKTTGRYVKIAILLPDTSSYRDSFPAPGTTYWYKVTAYNGGGESNSSKEISITTPFVGSMDFQVSFAQLWTALVISIADLNWQLSFIDEDAGIIRFKTSYLYSGFLKFDYNRLYSWPKKNELRSSRVDKHVQHLSTNPELIFDHYVFSREDLNIRVTEWDGDLSRVQINFNMRAYSSAGEWKPGNSNGVFEEDLLAEIQSNLQTPRSI